MSWIWTGHVGGALLATCAATVVYLQLTSEHGAAALLWRRYVDHLRAQLRFLMIRRSAERLAAWHVLLVTVLFALAVALRSLGLVVLVPVVAMAPTGYLARKRDQRVLAIEAQLVPWLTALASALKSTASIGEALRTTVPLSPDPIRSEIALVLKEVALGAPLGTALESAGRRIGSARLSSALAALLIARRTGGALAAVVEQTADTLREIERLEGVVRTKTAEGKSQSYVLAAVPLVLSGILQLLDSTWLPRYFQSGLGMAVLAGAVVLWIGSIFVARKVLAVDI